jgi:LPXTG-motif cell wall-anchored protein
MVKVSYFPNWTATGAEGPWRATPSLMVVVPTQKDVVLEFRDTWAESGGKVLTVVGVGALLAIGGLVLWRRRVSAEESAAS